MFPERVLIVEDESITARFIRSVLKKCGCSIVGSCDNAAEALEAVQQLSPQLVLMDINIKGGRDGLQTAREMLKKRPLPIVFITAHNNNATLSQVFELGSYGFVAKPFTDRDLEEAVRSAYKQFLMRQEKPAPTDISSMIELGDNLYFDLESSLFIEDGRRVKLNTNQLKLLQVLVEKCNQTVGYTQLSYEIWPDEDVSESALRTVVYSIRKLAPSLQIATQSKQGYMLQTLCRP